MCILFDNSAVLNSAKKIAKTDHQLTPKTDLQVIKKIYLNLNIDTHMCEQLFLVFTILSAVFFSVDLIFRKMCVFEDVKLFCALNANSDKRSFWLKFHFVMCCSVLIKQNSFVPYIWKLIETFLSRLRASLDAAI